MTLQTSRRLLLGAGLAAPFIRTASAQTTLEWVAGSVGGGWYTMAAGLSSLIREENPDLQRPPPCRGSSPITPSMKGCAA